MWAATDLCVCTSILKTRLGLGGFKSAEGKRPTKVTWAFSHVIVLNSADISFYECLSSLLDVGRFLSVEWGYLSGKRVKSSKTTPHCEIAGLPLALSQVQGEFLILSHLNCRTPLRGSWDHGQQACSRPCAFYSVTSSKSQSCSETVS